jgi:flagellar L-ring protein precursor FlgH
MKNLLFKAVLTISLLITFTGNFLFSQTAPIKKGGLIADVRANKIGDIITIVINESAQASNTNNTQTNKQSQMAASADLGNSFLKNITGTISASDQNKYTGSGQVSTEGRFQTLLTASIVAIREDGNFLIRGSREVETNGEKVVTVVEGVIRPEDVSRDNTISSAKIADARIYHQGSGVATQAHRPGLLTRILNWIF